MRITPTQRLTIAALSTLNFAAAQALADVYTWNLTAASAFPHYEWNIPANWTPNTAFPNAAGDVANLNINIAGTQTIRLQQDITVGILNLGDLDGTHATTISTGTGTNTLTFDNGVSNAELNVENAGTIGNTISAPIALSSDLIVNLKASTVTTNRASLTMSGGLTLNGNTMTIIGGMKFAGQTGPGGGDGIQMTISGADVLVGNGTIINNSDSPVVISGDKALFTGTLVANGQAFGNDGNSGTFTLNHGASVRNAAEIIINGAHDGSIHLGAKLQIGTGSAQAPSANQRLSQNRITMNGGFLNDAGLALSAGNTGFLQQDNVANFNFNSAFSWVNVAASTASAGNLLNVATVERGEGATAFFRASAPSTGSDSQTVIHQMRAANGASLVVGSTATSGTATRIIPWMVASTNVSNNGIFGFATYDAAEGFRALRTGEFATAMTAGANVQTGAAFNALASDMTINSLVYGNAGIVSMDLVTPVGRVVTINSGALAFTTNGGSIGVAGNADGRAGTIAFGAAEGLIFTAFNNTNGIGAVLTGTGGLTKGGTGTLVLTGLNTISGDTHVSGGTLQVGDANFSSRIGSGDVRVHTGATLRIMATNAAVDLIGDDMIVYLDAFGLFNGKMDLGAGIMETVGGLYLGGVPQAAGTWGSTASAAQFQNDTFFSGTGILNVVPEPASMLLLAAGSLLMGVRRRA
jgi:autotransporter-associated beta strand protein